MGVLESDSLSSSLSSMLLLARTSPHVTSRSVRSANHSPLWSHHMGQIHPRSYQTVARHVTNITNMCRFYPSVRSNKRNDQSNDLLPARYENVRVR